MCIRDRFLGLAVDRLSLRDFLTPFFGFCCCSGAAGCLIKYFPVLKPRLCAKSSSWIWIQNKTFRILRNTTLNRWFLPDRLWLSRMNASLSKFQQCFFHHTWPHHDPDLWPDNLSVPNCTWWNSHKCKISSSQTFSMWSCMDGACREKLAQSFYTVSPAETRTHELLVASPTLCWQRHNAIETISQLPKICKRIEYWCIEYLQGHVLIADWSVAHFVVSP